MATLPAPQSPGSNGWTGPTSGDDGGTGSASGGATPQNDGSTPQSTPSPTTPSSVSAQNAPDPTNDPSLLDPNSTSQRKLGLKPPSCKSKCIFDPNYAGKQTEFSPKQPDVTSNPGLEGNMIGGAVSGASNCTGGGWVGAAKCVGGVGAGVLGGAISGATSPSVTGPDTGYGYTGQPPQGFTPPADPGYGNQPKDYSTGGY